MLVLTQGWRTNENLNMILKLIYFGHIRSKNVTKFDQIYNYLYAKKKILCSLINAKRLL